MDENIDAVFSFVLVRGVGRMEVGAEENTIEVVLDELADALCL